MKNPLQDISVYRLSHRKHGDRLIVVAYGKSGTVYAWAGYSENVIGKAGGGGYDKTSTALADAVGHYLYQESRIEDFHLSPGSSFSSVEEALKKTRSGWSIKKVV